MSGLVAAVEAYHETLAELYAYFIPHPIELLHKLGPTEGGADAS